jgi:hypothetical protein
MSGFKRATKAATKLRAAFSGTSGAGKTFTALRVGTGLGGRIAAIDTEGARRVRTDGTVEELSSIAKYGDRFSFDVQVLENKSIAGYLAAIKEAADAGYDVLVIDSLTHAWQTLLEDVDKMAKAKYGGNTWSAWSDGTPLQKKLVQAILGYPGHVIVTMRSKTEWTTVDDGKGKKRPQRVGLAPEQGKGIEYEFDLLVEISADHVGHVIKDRTGKFQDRLIEMPGEDFGRQLSAWLADGDTASAGTSPAAPPVALREAPAGTVHDDAPLAIRVATHIAQAGNVRTLGRIGDRIDALASEGQLTADEAADLTAAIDRRHAELEPQEVASAQAKD